jgi:DNA replicative helicase MCM subunit Mcm2 (Cdc46/Mcm family)
MAKPTNTITTRVAVIEEQSNRFETAIEKLVEVSQSLKEIIAVQAQQIQDGKNTQDLLRQQIDKETNILHKKIKELDSELYEELEKNQKEVLKVLEEMRKEQKEHHEKMNVSVDKITKEIRDETNREIQELSNKINSIQKWRWFVVGAASAVGFLVSLIFNSFKFII